jgi:hypothetical protein
MYRTHTLPFCTGIAVTLLLLAGTSARADLLQWGYNWEPNSAKIAANGGSGYLSLTDTPSKSASGNSNTIITNLRAFSTATSASPDVFTHANYSFTLQLQDLASQQTGSVTFSGFFKGTLTGNSANIQIMPTTPTTETLTLGGNTYTVTLGTYSPPGPPGAANAGSLNAVISATAGSGGGIISSAPEPSTLILASLAVPCLGLPGWRKRRNQTRTPIAA